ncbi:hypothetical protein ACKKBG_A23890 [Auxenochlorella protothecoides x Auxenochlorella symbiontica]
MKVAYGSAESNLGGSSASSYDDGPCPLQLSLPAASSVNPNRHPVCASIPQTGPLSCCFGSPCTSTRYHRHTMCLPAHPPSLLGDRRASLNGEPAHSHACAAQVWQGQLRQPCSIHLSSSAKLVDDVIILIPPVTSLELLRWEERHVCSLGPEAMARDPESVCELVVRRQLIKAAKPNISLRLQQQQRKGRKAGRPSRAHPSAGT